VEIKTILGLRLMHVFSVEYDYNLKDGDKILAEEFKLYYYMIQISDLIPKLPCVVGR